MRPGVLLAKLPPPTLEDDRRHGSVTGRGGGLQRQGEREATEEGRKEGGDSERVEGEEKG